MGGLTGIPAIRKKVHSAYLYCGKPFAIIRRLFGGIAQLGERLHGMQEVSGSIPLTSTNSKWFGNIVCGQQYGQFSVPIV